MSKKITEIKLDNGVVFRPDIMMKNERKQANFFPLIQLAATVAAAVAVIYMLPAFLDTKNGSYMITNQTQVIMTVIFTALAALLSTAGEKLLKVTGLGFMLANALYILPKTESVVSGFMYTINLYTKRAGFSKPFFAQAAAETTWSDLEIFLIAFSFVLTLLISFGCIYRINFPLLFVATFPIFELGTFWGWEPYNWSAMLMMLTWVVILSINLINHTARRKGSSNTFAVQMRKKIFYMTSENIKRRFFGVMSSALLFTILCVFIFTGIFTLTADSVRPKQFKKLRYDISKAFEEASQEISERAAIVADPLPGRGKMTGGTNGGRLGVYDQISFSGKIAMKVHLPQLPRAMYLRGYVGEQYLNNSWEPIKDSSELTDYFKDHGATVLDYNYIQELYYNDENYQRSSMTIDPVNCSKDLIYAPYGTSYSSIKLADDQTYDGMMSPKKKNRGDEYQVSFLDNPDYWISWEAIVCEKCVLSSRSRFYKEYEIYSNTVQNSRYFAEIPEKTIPVLDEIIEASGASQPSDISEIQSLLRDYFSDNGFTYDLKPGVTPEGEEFVNYFLTEQKRGYCTYYASAGVMLMRRLGYPARYVEGYVIEPQQFVSPEKTIVISDRSAHAWCEVFINGWGWFPIELTPGYENDNPNLTDSEKNIKTKQPASPAQTASKADSSSSPHRSDSSETRSRADSSRAGSEKNSSHEASSSAVSGKENSSGAAAVGVGTESGGNGRGAPAPINSEQLGYTLMILGFAAVFVLAAAVRRKHRLAAMSKLTGSRDSRRAVIGCYTVFLKYSRLLGADDEENLTDVQLTAKIADSLNEKIPELSRAFCKLSDAAICACMSDNEITEQERLESRQTLRELKNKIYERLSFFQRLKAKWILGLY